MGHLPWDSIVALVGVVSMMGAASFYTEWVTAKEQLQQLVAHLGEEQASRALALLEPLVADSPEQDQGHPLPEFVGLASSGRSDLSQRVDELLAKGFGR